MKNHKGDMTMLAQAVRHHFGYEKDDYIILMFSILLLCRFYVFVLSSVVYISYP